LSYLLEGQPSELERLRIQSRVWEPAGQRLLDRLGSGAGLRALEVGCGAMGWLRILSAWAGENGSVVGTDIDPKMIEASASFLEEEKLGNVTLLRDDFFASTLELESFDLVHLRFQLAPLGRAQEQVRLALGFLKPGGWIALEEPDTGGWRENPLSPSAARLRELILESFARASGDFEAGRRLPEYLRDVGIEPGIAAETIALPPGHAYLRVPVQFAVALRPRLIPLVGEAELDRLIAAADAELAVSNVWGTPFTVIQAWGRKG
jgi:SAM-dependent methyltransferase